MENHLWIRWMGQLEGDEVELLQNPAIERRMKRLRGWNPGVIHTDDDSREGVERAAEIANALDRIGKKGILAKAEQSNGGDGPSVTTGRVFFPDVKGFWGRIGWPAMIDEWADNGDEVTITHVTAGDTWLYGRVQTTKHGENHSETYYKQRESWRRSTLL